MKLTKRGFGSYFDALQFGYAISTLSWNRDEKLKKIFHSLFVCRIYLIEDAIKFYNKRKYYRDIKGTKGMCISIIFKYVISPFFFDTVKRARLNSVPAQNFWSIKQFSSLIFRKLHMNFPIKDTLK